MQNEITNSQKLLDKDGHLNQCGYAKKLILDYNRSDIKANRLRIKEWDYYYISNGRYSVALTIADNSYMGLISVSLLDFEKIWSQTTSVIVPFTIGSLNLPSTSKTGDAKFSNKRVKMEFLNDGTKRHLLCELKDFSDKKPFSCDITLTDEPVDSMVIATPFAEDKKAFYYNQKINCMKASGKAIFDGREYEFTPEDSFGTLDWGRGVWTYKNTWYWGSGSGLVNGKPFGFNIGYGFGDTTAASENMLFYDGTAHKLDRLTFNIPRDENGDKFMEPWTFTSSDKRFEMNFIPILDRKDYSSFLFISSNQHQVFGKYSGRAVLDDGTVLELKDFMGFAEKVTNKW